MPLRLRFLLLALLSSTAAHAYSPFTHLELIDLTWDSSIRPLLIRRYPAASALELEGSRAFAYGGCLIQDLGYYPFGER